MFRRELLGGAPQKAAVRVVARVARRMTFEDGKAISANVQNAWRIRSDGYDFNVAPLGDNHEMVALRPEAADLGEGRPRKYNTAKRPFVGDSAPKASKRLKSS